MGKDKGGGGGTMHVKCTMPRWNTKILLMGTGRKCQLLTICKEGIFPHTVSRKQSASFPYIFRPPLFFAEFYSGWVTQFYRMPSLAEFIHCWHKANNTICQKKKQYNLLWARGWEKFWTLSLGLRWTTRLNTCG